MNWHPAILDMQQLLNFSRPPCTQEEKKHLERADFKPRSALATLGHVDKVG